MASIKRVFDNVSTKINRLQQLLALDLYAGLTRVTPRNTGRAQASWRITEGVIDPSVEPSGQSSYTVKPAHLPAPAQKEVMYHITNNLPYIIPLNEGHSQQAGKHFVEQEMRASKKRVLDSERV